MTTTIDASGVEHMDATLVAVRVLSPRAIWNRTKVRALRSMRAVRAQAAARQAAIAQFVKPYWERIPSGLPGFALLATLSNGPAYRWVMRRVQTGTGLLGRVVKTGLTWSGRALRWAGRSLAGAAAFLMPKTAARFGDWVERASLGTSIAFESVCETVSIRHREFYVAATAPAALATIRRYSLPLAVAAGINLASQGLLAALVSGIPFIGIPLAAAISTTKGMAIAGALIMGTGVFDGYAQTRLENPVIEYATKVEKAAEKATEVIEGAVVPPMPSDEQLVLVKGDADVVSQVVNGERVFTVKGDVTPEEATALIHEAEAKSEALEAEELKTLEAELNNKPQTAAQKRAAAKTAAQAHGPQGKRRGRPPGSGKKVAASAATASA